MSITNYNSTNSDTTAAGAYTPEDLGKLVDVALKGESVAARAFTVVSTNKDSVRFPKFTANPSVAHYEELDVIALDDPDTDEVVVPIYRTAGATRISRELAADSTPDISSLVGRAVSEQIIRSVDSAALGNTTAKGPDGLLSTSYTAVAASGGLSNVDPFISAIWASRANRGEVTTWLMNTSVAEQLSHLKKATGSQESLLEFVDDGFRIAGKPVIVSDHVAAGTLAWGISKAHSVLVVREGTTVERSTQSAFLSYAVDLMANFRYGVGFLHEPANVRIASSFTYTVTAVGDGTFTLKVNGKETAAVNEDVSAASLKTAIVAVDDGIEAADVTVTGSAGTYTVVLPAALTKGTDTGSTVSAVVNA